MVFPRREQQPQTLPISDAFSERRALPCPSHHPSLTPAWRGCRASPLPSQWSLPPPPPPLSPLPSAGAVVAPCPHRSAAGAPAPPALPARTAAPGPGAGTVEASWSGRCLLRPRAPARSHPPGAASPSARRAGPAALLGPHPEARGCARGIVGRAGPPLWGAVRRGGPGSGAGSGSAVRVWGCGGEGGAVASNAVLGGGTAWDTV